MIPHAARARGWMAVLVAIFVVVAMVRSLKHASDQPLIAAPGEELTAAEQRRLPIKESLGSLCPDASTPPNVERRLRRQAERLLVELERRPNALVRYTYYTEQRPPRRKWITIRKLAEEVLHDLEVPSRGPYPDCAPELQRRLRAVLAD